MSRAPQPRSAAAPAEAAGAVPRPFARSLPMQLMRAREAVMERFRPHLAARNLTDQQWRIIRALAEEDALDIAAISERCCILPASLSRMLPLLERAGLVSRRGHAHDQRRTVISLTAKGRRLFATMAAESEAIYAAIAQDIGPERIDLLYRLLDETIAVLRPAAPRNGRRIRSQERPASPD